MVSVLKPVKEEIMKAILNKPAFLFSLGVAVMMIFNGCEVDHSLDPYKYGKVYMPQAINNPVKVSAIFDFDTTQTVVYGAAYGGPKRPAVSIPVRFSVNASLVDSFNNVHLTDYPLLPEGSYRLGKTQAVIPAGKKATPALQLALNNKTDLPNGQYLLPVTMEVAGTGAKEADKKFQVNGALQTTYFLINAHGFVNLPAGHNYAAVFSDHPLNPAYIFFVGIPSNKTDQWIWKYDIENDTLVTGFPKKATAVFSFPYAQIQEVTSAGWYRGNPFTSLNFYGNGHFYHVLLQEGNGQAAVKQETGPLHALEELSDQPWPANFPQHIDCTMWISNRIRNFLFSGDIFGVTRVNAKNQWRARTGTSGVGGPEAPWPGVPESFTQQGLSGCYYDKASQQVYFFSGNEFVIYEIGAPASDGKRLGEVRKIADYYNGL